MRKYATPVVSLSTRPQEQDCLEQSQTHQSYHYLSALSHSTSPQDIGVQIYSSAFENWSSFVRFYSLVKLYSRTDRYPYFTHSRGMQSSLRSKRFQSSYCAKVGADQKKGWRGRGRGEEETLPLPRHPFFFCSCPSFLDEPREETLATQATSKGASFKCVLAGLYFRAVLWLI